MARSQLIRKLLMVVLLTAIFAALLMLVGTDEGRELLHDPHRYGRPFQQWVAGHRFIAPAVFLLIFCSLGVLGLPVWWLQVLSGYGFGLFMGITWSMVGSTISAVGAASLSRFLLSDWFHRRVENHVARIRRLDERMGHNGLLVVSLVRLAHFIPAGPANLAFGLTRISLRDIAIATATAGIPTVAIFVAIGAARELLHDWRFIAALATINLLMIGAILLRYLRPEWFRSIGIE